MSISIATLGKFSPYGLHINASGGVPPSYIQNSQSKPFVLIRGVEVSKKKSITEQLDKIKVKLIDD